MMMVWESRQDWMLGVINIEMLMILKAKILKAKTELHREGVDRDKS